MHNFPHRLLIIILIAACLLILCSPIQALQKSRVVGGEGLKSDDAALIASVWRIGLCEIVPHDTEGPAVAAYAYEFLPGAFADTKRFATVKLTGLSGQTDIDPETMTASDIIAVGADKKVDALLCGKVNEAKSKFNAWSLLGGSAYYSVHIGITFQLYETKTGTLLWERTVKKYGQASGEAIGDLMSHYTMNVANDMVKVLMEDGLPGRDLSNNNPPTITCDVKSISFRTSAYKLKFHVSDDFSIAQVTVSTAGTEAPLKQWTVDQQTSFDGDCVVTSSKANGGSICINAKDAQGASSSLLIPTELSNSPLTGQIASATASSIFINLGSTTGVEPGMIFTVQSQVAVTDPKTGAALGTTSIDVGTIEVISSEDAFSTCKIIEGKPEDMVVGAKVY